MAEPQKVHPVQDPEIPATPTAPLFPRNSSKSDRGDPEAAAQPYHPPFQRTLPVVHSKPPKRRSCLCRCLCWTVSLFLILVLILGITIGILYLVFRPKLPKYSIDHLQVTQLELSNNNNSLYATFDVNITARNPNKKIGIYYEGGSKISVIYSGSKLAEGALPKFYQGHRNTTVLVVQMSGQTADASGLFSSLQQEVSSAGFVRLNLRVRQPVRVKLGKLKLPKVKFVVRCRLDVDSLSANNDISIKDSSCKFRLRL